jgi:hypothetical protein
MGTSAGVIVRSHVNDFGSKPRNPRVCSLRMKSSLIDLIESVLGVLEVVVFAEVPWVTATRVGGKKQRSQQKRSKQQ